MKRKLKKLNEKRDKFNKFNNNKNEKMISRLKKDNLDLVSNMNENKT